MIYFSFAFTLVSDRLALVSSSLSLLVTFSLGNFHFGSALVLSGGLLLAVLVQAGTGLFLDVNVETDSIFFLKLGIVFPG